MNDKRIGAFTYWGLIFLALGIFISVSIPSVYHMLIIIPGIIVNYRLIRDKCFELPKSAWILIAIVIWSYISNFANFDILNDVGRSFGKPKYLIFGVMAIALLRYAAGAYITTYKFKIIIHVFLYTIIIAAIYGFAKHRIFYEILPERVGGFTGVMRYGYGTSFVLTILIGALIHYKNLREYVNKRLLVTAIVFGSVGFLFSQTRGAMLGLICSLPFVIYFKNKRLGIAAFVCSIIGVSVLVIVSLSGGSKSSHFFYKFSGMGNMQRFSQYQAAFMLAKEKPIFGGGVNNFSSLCPEVKDKYNIDWRYMCKSPLFDCTYYDTHPRKQYCGHSHNIILEHAANLGVLGAILLLAWGLTWMFELWKMKTLFSTLLIPFLINVFIAGQFENIFDANNSFLIFTLYPLSFLYKPLKEATFSKKASN